MIHKKEQNMFCVYECVNESFFFLVVGEGWVGYVCREHVNTSLETQDEPSLFFFFLFFLPALIKLSASPKSLDLTSH